MDNEVGGSAFPRYYESARGNKVQSAGMTLRDYFAAKALEGFCASPHTTIEWLRDHCATSCYQMADALLKARAE